MSGQYRDDIPPGDLPGDGNYHHDHGGDEAAFTARPSRSPAGATEQTGRAGPDRPARPDGDARTARSAVPARPGAGGRSGGGHGHERARRPAGMWIGPVAGIAGIALLLAVGAWALLDSRNSCRGANAVKLDVATAPDIAPAVAEIVKNFNAEPHDVDGRCVRAVAKPADPAQTATLLSGQGSAAGQRQPDVWIPDSSLWVTLVHSSEKGGVTVSSTPTSVAHSPIVAAVPRSQAAKLAGSGARPTWNALLKASGALGSNATKGGLFEPGSIRIQALDPARHAGGLAPLVITHMMLQNDPEADKVLAAVIRGLQHNVSADTRALFGSFKRDARGRWPVAILPEQAVWKYNKDRAESAAVAVYPSDGTLSMNYPYALVSKDPDKLRGAELLRAAMTTRQARSIVQRFGFRGADDSAAASFGPSAGVNPKPPQALPAPNGRDVDEVVQAWGKLTLGTRMLALLDVSGSMGTDVTGGASRLEATARAAHEGLALYPNENEVGVWLFSTRLDGKKDYRQLLPIGRLGDRIGSTTRRQQIIDNLGRLRPKPNGDTGLYDSIWAGYRKLQGSYRPDMYNILLILTDGANDDKDGITLARLLKNLKGTADPSRPVVIVPIGVGPDIDLKSMSRIAGLTSGKAYGVAQPKDVQKVFIDVVARRVCAPNCPAKG